MSLEIKINLNLYFDLPPNAEITNVSVSIGQPEIVSHSNSYSHDYIDHSGLTAIEQEEIERREAERIYRLQQAEERRRVRKIKKLTSHHTDYWKQEGF